MIGMSKWVVALTALCIASAAYAQSMELPQRQGERPRTTNGVPHVQVDFEGKAELSAELARRVSEFPGVTLGATRVSLPGALGFQLSSDMPLAQPNSIVGGLEFAHLHPDGSLHASLDPELAVAAVQAGWAVAHPWADQNDGWEGFVMIYSPLNEQELDVVTQLVEQSYAYITGKHPTE